MAAVAEPTRTRSALAVISDLLGEDELQAIRDTDERLREIVTEQGGVPTAKQVLFFSRQGWEVSPHTIRNGPHDQRTLLYREIPRMSQVVRFEQIAGTKADRSALAQQVAKSAAELADRGEQIAAEIDKLMSERAKLQRAADSSARRQEEANAAAQSLRDHVPAAVKMAAEISHGSYYSSPESRAFLDIHSEYVSTTGWAERADQQRPMNAYEQPEEWASLISDAVRRLPKLEKSYGAAKLTHDAAEAESKSMLDFYIV